MKSAGFLAGEGCSSEGPIGASHVNQAREGSTGAPAGAAHAPQDATDTPADAAHAPQDATDTPADAAHAPAGTTGLQVDAAHTPAGTTGLPVEAAHAPSTTGLQVDAAHTPAGTTGSPADIEGRPLARRQPRSLDRSEIDAILQRNWWGVLATAVDGRPYAVPVAYGYDGEALYIATGPGEKLSNILKNPMACFTVSEVETGGTGGAGWRSVVLTGEAAPIRKLGARLAAFNVLRRQVAGRLKASPRDAAKIASASVIRLVPTEVTGRST